MDINTLNQFCKYLAEEEKSQATIAKYQHDVCCFHEFMIGKTIDKISTMAYKEHLCRKYAPASVNSMLVALNCYLRFLGYPRCCVRLLKIQRRIFSAEEKELSKSEYLKLLKAAGDSRLSLLLQTICGTGIRISELQYITVESVRCGKAIVSCKNKTRVVFLPAPLQKLLKVYIKKPA